jgi:hypothetical protein
MATEISAALKKQLYRFFIDAFDNRAKVRQLFEELFGLYTRVYFHDGELARGGFGDVDCGEGYSYAFCGSQR